MSFQNVCSCQLFGSVSWNKKRETGGIEELVIGNCCASAPDIQMKIQILRLGKVDRDYKADDGHIESDE